MPEKACPDCGQKQHVRVRECVCGFVFPRKVKKVKKEVDLQDVDYTFNNWKKVPPRTRLTTCGTCRRKIKGGMIAWHASYTDGDKFWWCENCLKDFKDETFYKLSEDNG